jgi:hypothetical protein
MIFSVRYEKSVIPKNTMPFSLFYFSDIRVLYNLENGYLISDGVKILEKPYFGNKESDLWKLQTSLN